MLTREGDSDEPLTVSVVIPCRNAEQYIAHQLKALSLQTSSRRWELVVSDNGSTDRTRDIVKSYESCIPRLLLVDSSSTPGPGAARNAGVRAASAEFILFCDADDEVDPGWLEAMATALERSPFVAAHIDRDRLNKARPVSTAPERGLLQSEPPFLPYTFGGAIGVRRTIHDSIGGFDERYRDACEDRDYCYRLQLAGVSLTFVPDALLYYRHRTSPLDLYRQARRNSRGQVLIYREYRHLGQDRPSLIRGLMFWLAMPFRLVPALTSKRRFGSWMLRLGRRIGRIEGCLRYRVWAP